VQIVARIVAALAAVAVYLLFWWLVAIGWLFFATWRGYHIPGYHEPGIDAWWAWLVYAAWWAGLAAVAWWAGFRLPWWRRERAPERAT
jgi:hypothetical protein